MTEIIQGYSEADQAVAIQLQDKGAMKGQKLQFFLECVKNNITTKGITIEPQHVMMVIKEALAMGIDPTGRDIYAFLMKDKQGKINLTFGVTIDGWARILDKRHCSFEFKSKAKGKVGDKVFDSELECIISVPEKDGVRRVPWTTCYNEARTSNPLWGTMPQQMMQVRALARCARMALSMGVYDVDEAKAFFEQSTSAVQVAPAIEVAQPVEPPSLMNKAKDTLMQDLEPKLSLESELAVLRKCKTKEEARKCYASSPLRSDPEYQRQAIIIANEME